MCYDTQTSTVHKRHNVFDKSQTAFTYEFGFCVFIDEFAGRSSFDTFFVLDTTHVYASVAFVVYKHRKPAPVLSTLFGTCKYEVNIGVAVGDEAFHAVKPPAVLFFVERGSEHNSLQVGACIGLC